MDPALDVPTRVRRLVAEESWAQLPAVKPESRLADDLAMDSLDIVALTLAVEKEFDLQIPDEDAQRLLTVQDVVAYVEGRLTAV